MAHQPHRTAATRARSYTLAERTQKAARVLLRVIETNPEAVDAALAAEAGVAAAS